MHCLVKPSFLIFSISSLALVCGVVRAQKPLAPLPPLAKNPSTVVKTSNAAPPDVEASASMAVAKLGDEVVLGHYQAAIDHMNPLWKKRTADEMGGMDLLNKKLANVPKQLVERGISIISFKPKGQPRSYEVSPGKKVEKVGGQEVESLIFTKWMVFVPTVTQYRFIRPGDVKPMVIDSVGFQVAIADKGSNDWSFIDGTGVSVADLRNMYGTLPMDLELPPTKRQESR
jgi:hypothetical protein